MNQKKVSLSKIRNKVKQRIYIVTSVFGGYFDEEFKEHYSKIDN